MPLTFQPRLIVLTKEHTAISQWDSLIKFHLLIQQRQNFSYQLKDFSWNIIKAAAKLSDSLGEKIKKLTDEIVKIVGKWQVAF